MVPVCFRLTYLDFIIAVGIDAAISHQSSLKVRIGDVDDLCPEEKRNQ
jgi:hypothetical protein